MSPVGLPRKSRERRACVRCGFERTVLVRSYADGTQSWTDECGACAAEARAAFYAKLAMKWHAKATAMRWKRQGGMIPTVRK